MTYLVDTNNLTITKNLPVSYYNKSGCNLLISDFFDWEKFIETKTVLLIEANRK